MVLTFLVKSGLVAADAIIVQNEPQYYPRTRRRLRTVDFPSVSVPFFNTARVSGNPDRYHGIPVPGTLVPTIVPLPAGTFSWHSPIVCKRLCIWYWYLLG